MSSSGLIYAVIVGAWAAYLVPMWLRRQDELNEARPTERFSTAIRLLSGRAAMERRYAKDLQARVQEGEPTGDPDGFTGSVDVRALAVPTTRRHQRPARAAHADGDVRPGPDAEDRDGQDRDGQGRDGQGRERAGRGLLGRKGRREADGRSRTGAETPTPEASAPARRASAAQQAPGPSVSERYEPGRRVPRQPADPPSAPEPPAGQTPVRGSAAAEAAARARRSKVLARRRRTTMILFVAFTLGAVAAAFGGVAFLWAPGVPALLLSAYIGYLRRQERRRFTYTMDRRRAEVAAQRLRERRPRARAGGAGPAAVPEDEPADPDGAPAADPGHAALTAGRRALVEQTDHAEWVDDQRERRHVPSHGASWDPVPVPLPTYVTAPVAPRSGRDVDLGAPDTWSSARSSPAEPPAREADARRPAAGTPNVPAATGRAGNGREGGTRTGHEQHADPTDDATDAAGAGSASDDTDDGSGGTASRRSTPRRAAAAFPQRRKGQAGAPGARSRGRTPLFDQYADGDRPRAAGQ